MYNSNNIQFILILPFFNNEVEFDPETHPVFPILRANTREEIEQAVTKESNDLGTDWRANSPMQQFMHPSKFISHGLDPIATVSIDAMMEEAKANVSRHWMENVITIPVAGIEGVNPLNMESMQ